MELTIETMEGVFVAHYSERGLARLDFPKRGGEKKRKERSAVEISAKIQQWHALTTRALTEALNGQALRELPPLDLSVGTDFQRKVWDVLRRIKPGRTMSYGEVAAAVGKPKASRAVGSACGANPIPVLVPCHRVLAANHGLGGFGGGLAWKRKLLACESTDAQMEELRLKF